MSAASFNELSAEDSEMSGRRSMAVRFCEGICTASLSPESLQAMRVLRKI